MLKDVLKQLIIERFIGRKHEVKIQNLTIYNVCIVRCRCTNNNNHFDFKIKS